MNRSLLFVLLLATGVALADDAPETKSTQSATEAQAKTKDDAKKKEDPNLGMSILGNQEAPKSLVIVPWKSSEIGKSLGISTMLDDSRQPIDKEVFMRMLNYYEIRSGATRGASAAGRETAQPATAVHRRKS
jgi:hypothetical protein